MKLFYFISILLFTICTFAQVNTEKYRTAKDLQGIAGYLEVTGTIQTGNTEETEAEVDGRLDWRTGSVLTFLIFESEYKWVDGNRSSNEGLIHVRHVRKLSDFLKLEAFAQANYDRNLKIIDRELIGAGFRYTLFDFTSSDITIASAYMFEHENYDLSETAEHASEVNVSRWSNYLTYRFSLNPYVILSGVLYYQPMFSQFSDYRVLYVNNLETEITKQFSFIVNFKFRYDSYPADGVKTTDTKTDFGIAFKF